MLEQDYILLIMNCKKYEYKAQQQKDTWLLQLPSFLIYFHVIGEKNMEKAFEFDYINKILFVKTEDDYISLPKKVMAAYDAIIKTYKFKYIFKTDDDQNVLKPLIFDKIKNIINMMNPTPHYGGQIVDIKNPYFSQYYKIHTELPKNIPMYVTKYCSGRFYFLSFEAIMDLLSKREKISGEYFEDYSIGYYLKKEFKENILSFNSTKVFEDFIYTF